MFPHLRNKNDYSGLIGLCWGINDIIYPKFLQKRCRLTRSDPNSRYEREWVMPRSSHSDTSFYVELGGKMACMESHHSPQHIFDSQQTFIRFKSNCSKTFYPGSSCPFRMAGDAWHSPNLVSLVRMMQALSGLKNNIGKSWVDFTLLLDLCSPRHQGVCSKLRAEAAEPRSRSRDIPPFLLPADTLHGLQHASL